MTKMNYGVPYQGSKNRIATLIMNELPAGKRFVDLMAGGCALTHAAMLSGKYKRFLCNDLYPSGSNLFRNAMNGEYSKPEYLRWVSREDFFKEKDTDDFVKLCYSFGNGGITYLYGKKLEPLKKGFHYAVVFDDWRYLEQYAKDNNWREGLIDELKKSVDGLHTTNERRLALHRCAIDSGLQEPSARILPNLSRKTRLDELNYRLENLEMMNRLQGINERRLKLTKPAFENGIIRFPHNMVENLEMMNRLQNIDISTEQQIEFTSFDYRDYQHEDGDVVYCDPPYAGTEKYDGNTFDHAAFWEWVRTRDYPVYVSEYSAPDDFISIWQKGIMKLRVGGKSAHKKAIEHLFIHRKWLNGEIERIVEQIVENTGNGGK